MAPVMPAHVPVTTSPDPAAQLARAVELRSQADAIEADAILRALEASGWRVQPAAMMLGMPYTSLIQVLKGRHREIGAQVEKKRQEIGGVRRPNSPAK